jgi:hypothetical protein
VVRDRDAPGRHPPVEQGKLASEVGLLVRHVVDHQVDAAKPVGKPWDDVGLVAQAEVPPGA